MLLACALLSGCSLLPRKPQDYAATMTASGLVVQELVVAPPPYAQLGDRVVLHYTGWLSSGEQFDSSLDRDEPLRITLGDGEVKPGIEEGVVGMGVNGRRKIVVPPHLAYGHEGLPGIIPPDESLTFELELVAIE